MEQGTGSGRNRSQYKLSRETSRRLAHRMVRKGNKQSEMVNDNRTHREVCPEEEKGTV